MSLKIKLTSSITSSLSSFVFHNLTDIGNYAFSTCKALLQVSIPSTVSRIGSSAFSGCSVLADVTLNEGAASASINSSAFSACPKLRQF